MEDGKDNLSPHGLEICRDAEQYAEQWQTRQAELASIVGLDKDATKANPKNDHADLGSDIAGKSLNAVITVSRGALGLPGPSDQSRRLAEELLTRDHDEHHIFFNDSGFHNHLTHHLLATLSLGTQPSRLHEIFRHHESYLLPMPERRGPITPSNWRDHLGQRERYPDYLDFFDHILRSQPVPQVVETFALDPDVLPRLVSGAFHPMIHIGNGIEFCSVKVVAQGLAEACVTEPTMRDALHDGDEEALMEEWERLDIDGGREKEKEMGKEGKAVADLLEVLRNDKELNGLVSWGDDGRFKTVVRNAGWKIKKLVKEWGCHEDNLDTKLKDLYTSCALAYGASTRPGHSPKLDFFLMHALTSVSFLPAILPTLSNRSHRVSLLKAHLAATLAFYVAEGRPMLHIQTLLAYEPRHKTTLNPWTEVIQLALAAEEEHVPKTVRALIHCEVVYGWSNAAWLHAAQASVDVAGNWYFNGVGFDEAWTDG